MPADTRLTENLPQNALGKLGQKIVHRWRFCAAAGWRRENGADAPGVTSVLSNLKSLQLLADGGSVSERETV